MSRPAASLSVLGWLSLAACGQHPDPEALVIEATYARLADYAASADVELDFRIDRMQTIPASAFDRTSWRSVATMPEGDRIGGSPRSHTETAGGLSTSWSSYPAVWQPTDVDWRQTEEGRIAAVATVREVLDAAGDAAPDALSVTAITTYEVTAWLDGRERTWRAAFLWTPSAAGEVDFYPVDYVASGLGWAAREALPAFADERVRSLARAADAEESEGGEGGACAVTREAYGPKVVQGSGDNDHVSGQHEGYAELSGSCECTAACTSICNATVDKESCTDSGWTGWTHYMASDSGSSSDVKPGGGASCASAFACTATVCPFGIFCNGEVSVEVSGVTVTFKLDPGASMKVQDSLTITCGACAEVARPQ